MNKEEILAMEAGKGLDVLIADKVMGWEVREGYAICENGVLRTWEETSYKGFSPSTDISAAMEVEAKIKKMEWHIQHKYLLTLHQITGSYGEINLKDIFSMMQAPPVDRCKASFIAVMEDNQ